MDIKTMPIFNYFKFIILTVVFLFHSFSYAKEISLYVSPQGSDSNNGSITTPYRTLVKVQAVIRSLRSQLLNGKYKKVVINLRAGFYPLNKPLVFTSEDGGTNDCIIEFKAYEKEKVIISGGRYLPKKWIKMGKYWKLRLPPDINATYLNQLFADGKRLNRCSSKILYTAGPMIKYTDSIDSSNPVKYQELQKKIEQDILPHCTFSYLDKDLSEIPDIDNAEILLYHSWDCTWHNVYKVDEEEKVVYLRSPSYYPVGFFSKKTRYVVENSKKYLTKQGQWYFDKKKKELWYLARGSEDPNRLHFIVPQLNQLLILTGNETTNSPVQNIIFTNLNFQYTIAPRGINVESKVIYSFKESLPWLDGNTGFTDYQAATQCGQSVALKFAKKILFSSCSFSKLGNYGVKVDKYSDNNTLSNCSFSDLGGGGVIIGYNQRNAFDAGVLPSASPLNNSVIKCKLNNLGIIYPSAVGIAIMNAQQSYIYGNELYDIAYTGISCGWTWGLGVSYTYDNIIENNRIHDVMKTLADGGGIYTLGVQPGTVIKGNTIYNIHRLKDAIGSDNNGIFFDEGSSKIFVEKNRIYNIQNEKVRFNKSNAILMKWSGNNFEY